MDSFFMQVIEKNHLIFTLNVKIKKQNFGLFLLGYRITGDSIVKKLTKYNVLLMRIEKSF